jgi:hypothetical protein
MIKFIQSSPIAIAIGLLFGFLFMALAPAILDFGREQYERLRPVVSDWEVTNAKVDGDDLTVSGTMHKNRDCLLVPPVVARDLAGTPYLLESQLAWKSKDSSAALQPWGPWTVRNGAGKKLRFVMVYLCGGNYPSIIDVGTYPK